MSLLGLTPCQKVQNHDKYFFAEPTIEFHDKYFFAELKLNLVTHLLTCLILGY